MQLCVLMAVTTSMRFWNDYNAFDWRLCLIPKVGASIVFTIGFIVPVLHLTCILVILCLVAFSFLPLWVLLLRTSNGQIFFICIYRTES